MTSASILNNLWDGAPLEIRRVTRETKPIYDRRMSILWSIQPETANRFINDARMKTIGLLPRFLVSYQHLLLYPIILCARVNLYIQSFMYLLELGPFATRTNNPHKAMELVCLVGFFVYQGLVWSTIPSAYEAAICCAVAHVVSGILHVQIVLSHFSVPTYDGVKYGNPAEGVGPTKHETWAGVQFATTLNITCPSWMDWFHGGLHYQTEHHLFPKMPRHNLRAASSRVRTRSALFSFASSTTATFRSRSSRPAGHCTPPGPGAWPAWKGRLSRASVAQMPWRRRGRAALINATGRPMMLENCHNSPSWWSPGATAATVRPRH